MSHKTDKASADRRQYSRLPVVEGMIEPITLKFGGADGAKEDPKAAGAKGQPAILTNLSAGGMSLLMFLEPPHTKKLDMVLSIPGLSHVPVEGKVVRINQKGETYSVGIAFTRIGKKYQTQISSMAQDHIDCETRLALKLPEACVKTCTFHALCAKSQKAPYWPAR
ncbi:MAG: PilZ domain-containing protein [Elusimicrobiota bacterium]